MARWFSTQRRQSLCDALPHLISRGASRSGARGASRRRAGARGGRARAPAAAPPRASRARRGARAPSWRAAARGRRARAPAAGAPPRRRRAAARLRAGSRGRDWPSWPVAEPGSGGGGELPSWHLCTVLLVSGLGPWSQQPGSGRTCCPGAGLPHSRASRRIAAAAERSARSLASAATHLPVEHGLRTWVQKSSSWGAYLTERHT